METTLKFMPIKSRMESYFDEWDDDADNFYWPLEHFWHTLHWDQKIFCSHYDNILF